MKVSRVEIAIALLIILSFFLPACNKPQKEESGYGGSLSNAQKTDEQESLGEEKPTPTPHAGKVGSGKVEISSIVQGLGADLETRAIVPFTIMRTKQGAYQIQGSKIGHMRMDLEGTGCVCDGDYEVNSEINGTIKGANTGDCKIEFSETRTILSGDCECDCPHDQISCEDAFTDIEEIGPMTVDFVNEAQHYEDGEINGVSYDYMWVFKDLKFNSPDCFFPDVITSP